MNIFLKKPEKIYFKQILKLLQVISNFYPDESNLKFIWDSFSDQENIFAIIAVDTNISTIENSLVGFGSLHLTTKIRGGKIGFIEDIVIKENYRNKGIGRLILNDLINKAKMESCYKLVLDCKEETKNFYTKLGFKHSGNTMTLII